MSAHRGFAASVGLAALLALSGCSSVSGGGGPFSGIFGGGTSQEELEALPTAEEVFSPVQTAACPRPEVIQGAAAERSYRGGRTGSNQDLRYQISVVDLARECVATPEGLNRISVGVRGRVLIGPSGSPGSFTAPVRIRVRTPSTVYEDISRSVSVTVPAGQTIADFTLVEENLEIPLEVGENFIIEAGILR